MAVSGIDLGKYKLGWHDTAQYVYEPKKGLNEQVVRDISHAKSEPERGHPAVRELGHERALRLHVPA